MKKSMFFLLTLGVVILSSCAGKNINSCGNDVVSSHINTLVLKDFLQQLGKVKSNDGGLLFDNTKAESYFSRLTYALKSVRTERKEPDSNKLICSAELQYTFPVEIFSDANGVLISANSQEGNLESKAEGLNLTLNTAANTISIPISYTVHPTDDGKEVFVTVLGQEKIMASWLKDLIGYTMIKPMIENKKLADVETSQTHVSQQQEISPDKKEAVDWTSFFSAFEKGCVMNKEFEDFTGNIIKYDESKDLHTKGRIVLPNRLKGGILDAKLNATSSFGEYFFPMNNATYYGIPIKSLYFMLGNRTEGFVFTINLEGSMDEVRNALKNVKFETVMDEDYQVPNKAEIMIDEVYGVGVTCAVN